MANESNSLNNMETSPKKRVLFVVTQSELGGAQRFLYTLLAHLDKTKYELLVAAGPGSMNSEAGIMNYELLDRLGIEQIPTIRLTHLRREINPIHDLIALFELRKVIKKSRPDTIFLLSSKAGFIGSLAAVFPTRIKAGVIYRIGGWAFNDPGSRLKKQFWKFLERLSAKWKDVIIVNNKIDLEQAGKLKIKPRNKVVLIYNGIDAYKTEFLPKDKSRLKLFEKISGQAGGIFRVETIIGTIANFYPAKGLQYLIETAEYFKNNDKVIFIIIGDGQERNILEKFIEQKGLQKKVFLLGQVPDAYKLLSAFDIFVLYSVKEGFPWALIEAMAAKLPIIATRVGAVPEIIENGKNGIIVEPARPDQIAEKLQNLINDNGLKQELGIQAHQTVLFKFELDKMIKCIEELL